MDETEQPANLSCPIDLFPKQEMEVARLTRSINQVPTAAQKSPFAQSLLEAVTVLLECAAYDETNTNCDSCRSISELRRQTASLVMAAGRLDPGRSTQ